MDETLRKLERQRAQDPEDEKLLQQWIREKARMGSTKSKTYYKLRMGDKFLSVGNAEFTKIGSQFSNEKDAIKALTKYSRYNNFRGSRSLRTPSRTADEVEIVTFEVHIIEMGARAISLQEEIKKQKLKEIRAKKMELEKAEKKLLES